MKWLILYRDDLKSDAITIKQKLEKYSLESDILPVEKITNLEDENINVIVKNSTHCVLLDNNLFVNDKISFYYGFLISNAKKIYSLKNEWSSCMKFFKNAYIFASTKLLIDKIENHIEDLINEDKSSQAFSFLFNEGIPFTADCFAEYISKDNREICQKFIDAGIDINCRTKEGTPMLNVAIRSEQIECVNWLLSLDADIDAVSNDRGYSGVMDAVWKNNYEICKILIERNANLNYISRDGQSVLVLAVGAGKVEICKLLVEAGADPDIKDQMGMSAYEYAKLFGRTDLVDVLKKFHKE